MARIGNQSAGVVRVTAPAPPRGLSACRPADLGLHDLEDDATVKGVEFVGTGLMQRVAESVDVEQCRFDSARLTGSELRRCVFADSSFSACDFASFRGQDVSFVRCTVVSSRLTGSVWASGTFRDVRFEGNRGDSAIFRHTKFAAVEFSDCTLVGADFQSAELTNVRFVGCDLSGAQFSNAVLKRVRFENCTLLDVGGAASLAGAAVQGPGAMELALSLAREAGIVIEP